MASQSSDITLVRLIITEQNVQKLKLENAGSIDDLKKLIRDRYGLTYQLEVQYLDSDFNEFFNVSHIADIKHMGTIRLLQESIQSDEALSEHSMPAKPWPDIFPLPKFAENIYIRNTIENLSSTFMSGESVLVPEMLKPKIVAAMVEEVIKYTYYPAAKDLDNMCRALIEKFPCLKDHGPGGYTTWCVCVKFKMGNIRKTLKETVPEISCNTGKRSKYNPLAPSPHSGIKKMRSGIVAVPKNAIKEDDLEKSKRFLCGELKKNRPDMKEVKIQMAKTWPARWKFILEGPPVKEILEEWPGLQFQDCVLHDFMRLTNVSLEGSFFSNFDKVIPKILKLGAKKRELTDLCNSVSDDIMKKRELAIDVLRHLLGEKEHSPLIKVFEGDVDKEQVLNLKDCTIIKTEEKYELLVEKALILTDIDNLINAVYLMFAFIWVLNLQYPKDNKYVWEFIEKIVLKIGKGNLSAKIALFQEKLNSQ